MSCPASDQKSMMENNMNDIILETKNISYTYEDGTRALQDVSIQIHRGKKIALMGANGSGKSTFFLCLNGIYRPQAGELYKDGKPYDYSRKGLLKLRSQVGIVFQDPDNQLIIGNVRQEISFGILNMGVPMDEAERRVDGVMRELKIDGFAEKPTHALSGGQKKQVAVADILVMDPEVIILDEPSASLDPLHIRIIREMIDQLTARGITVLIATHDVDFAFEWADEVVLFCEGRKMLSGTPMEVFTQKTLLERTHLHPPVVLELFYRLQKKALIPSACPPPRTLEELEGCIEMMQPQYEYGRRKADGSGKKAVLVVSFGTSHADTREKTITVIEQQIAEAFPDCRMYRAWTSGMIIDRLKKRDGYMVDTVEEAIKRMLADGITQVTVQPTHIVNGIENDRMKRDVLVYGEQFEQIRFGTPLLTDDVDSEHVVSGIMEEFPGLEADTALIFMGHGTTHYANAIYAALDYKFKDMGYANVFVGTVEAYPSMETLKKLVKEAGYRKVILTPFMIVAGEHAKHDMASDDPESWKRQFEAEGLCVSCVVKGLGEYEAIRRIFLEHAKAAVKED